MEYQVLQQLEKRRYAVLLCNGAAIALFAVAILGQYASQLYLLFFIPAATLLFIGVHLRKQYALLYKQHFVEATLKNVFDDVRFMPDYGFDRDRIAGTNMVSMGNTYSSNDYLKASYKGVSFEQADVYIAMRSRRSNVTLFRGRWMIFEFNKAFRSDMQVRDAAFRSAKRGGWFSEREKMPEIYTESADFNGRFRVFAYDRQEAFYILTPHFMEQLTALNAKMSGPLLLCFLNNRLHIACDSRTDAFEPRILERVDPNTAIHETYRDIALLTQIIDTLTLNTTIFKEKRGTVK